MTTVFTERGDLYDQDEEDVAEKCGCEVRCCGFCRTKRRVIDCLSCCANPKMLLIYLSMAAFLQGFIVAGLVNVGITTIEKRFSLRSYETGLISTSYDIGVVPCLIIVTYFGGRSHKALWIGWGVFIMGCGSIVYTLPHFIATRYDHTGGAGNNLCNDVTREICPGVNLRGFRGFFIAGQLLHGIGASPLYTLGVTYLDENVSQRFSSTYHGIFFAFSLLGPGLGYIVGGRFLAIYTNIGEVVSFNDANYLWVGAWWVGFLIFGCLTILLSSNLIMFPYQFPNTEKHRLDREKEMNKEKMAERIRHDDNFGKSIQDLPSSILIFIKNKTLMFLTLAGTMENALVGGTATFGPKVLESVFNRSPPEAAFMFGLLALLGGILGCLVGGIIVTKFKLSVTHMLRLNLLSTILALGCTCIFLLSCENTDSTFAGASEGTLSFTCNSGCGCSQELYDPVCGSNNVTYFSPCHAGCSSSETEEFSSCSCVSGDEKTKAGTCAVTSCPGYALFLAIVFFLIFFTFFNTVPNIQWLVIRVAGVIPSVLIYEAVLDLACLVWDQECGERGSCKVYDKRKISNYIFACSFAYKGGAVIFSSIALFVYKPRVAETVLTDVDDVQKGVSAKESSQTSSNGHLNLAFQADDKSIRSIVSDVEL